jgi:hypothetical protein
MRGSSVYAALMFIANLSYYLKKKKKLAFTLTETNSTSVHLEPANDNWLPQHLHVSPVG